MRLTMDEVIQDLDIGTEPEVIQNRFGGGSIELSPLEVAVYDWIIGSEMFGKWENVRLGCDWFLNNNPEAYMVLLD